MFQTLVQPSELAAHLEDPDWCVLDCQYSLQDPQAGYASYLKGHVPGAIYANLSTVLSGKPTPSSGRHPLPNSSDLADFLSAAGVNSTVQVIAYDSSNGLFASRAWWLLRAMGHSHVAVLDGGLPAWQGAGLPMTDIIKAREPRHFIGQLQPKDSVSTADVTAGLQQRSIKLVDVRAAERFAGTVEPLDPVAGHIPGAISLPHSESLSADGKFKAPEALRALFSAQLGPQEPDNIVCMCGSGITACHTLLALERAGLTGARLYAGSWSEWCKDPTRPVGTGQSVPHGS